MILRLPERFDANEWFIIIVSLTAMGFVWKLPKRFPKSVAFLAFIVTLILAKLFDTILLLPPVEAYYVNDMKETELFDILLYFLYMPIGYLFLYAYDRLQPKTFETILLIPFTSLLAVFIEWIAVKLGIYHYTGWQLGYSFPVYLAVQSIYILLFERMKREYIRTKRQPLRN